MKGAASDADVIVLLTDVYGEPLADDNMLQRLQLTDRPVIVAINKMDLISNLTSGRAMKLPSKFAFEGRNTTPLKRRLLEKRRANLAGNATASATDTILDTDSTQNEQSMETSSNENEKDILQAQFELFEKIEAESKGNKVATPNSNANANTKSNTVSKSSASAPTSSSSIDEPVKSRFGSNRVELDAKPKTLEELKKIWGASLPKANLITISAQNSTGIELLLTEVLSHMKEGPKYFPDDQITTRDERFFAAEIIRESILTLYKDEIPYSCEVIVESFTDKSDRLSVIEANIMVSRASHKAIIIGKGGQMMKELGIVARTRLEAVCYQLF